MNYDMTTPCNDCPFLKKYKKGFTTRRLQEFIQGEFPCHKTAEDDEEEGLVGTDKSSHCAGALIYMEKHNRSHQMMRIAERLCLYDHTKLNMEADVR